MTLCCAAQPESRAQLLEVWSSPTSSCKERAAAANLLFDRGSSMHTVEHILGTDGKWCRYHGPSIQINMEDGTSTNKGYFVRWTYEYIYADGRVVFSILNPESRENAQFCTATYASLPICLSESEGDTNEAANKALQTIGTKVPQSER